MLVYLGSAENGEIDRLELENCVYSRAMMNGLTLVLPPEMYADWITR